MEKDNLIGILLLVVSILIIMLLVGLNLQTLMEASAELALIAVGTIATMDCMHASVEDPLCWH